MIQEIIRQVKTACLLLILLTIITGLLYPLVVTGLAQLLFSWQANGSIVSHNGKNIGSLLIGQSFTSPRYFLSRPSATTPFPYNGEASLGSNSGPSNPDFLATVKARVINLKQLDSRNNSLIPIDLVTASGSGLDPDISPFAAYYQSLRIAKERHISEKIVQILIHKHIKNRSFNLLGEPRINVLQLNLALDKLSSKEQQ